MLKSDKRDHESLRYVHYDEFEINLTYLLTYTQWRNNGAAAASRGGGPDSSRVLND